MSRRSSHVEEPKGGYDVILMAETVYSPACYQKLNHLIKKVGQWIKVMCSRIILTRGLANKPMGLVFTYSNRHIILDTVHGPGRSFRRVARTTGVVGLHSAFGCLSGPSVP